MGSAANTVSLSYTDQAGSVHRYSLAKSDTCTQLKEEDFVTGGAASQTITVGTKSLLLYATSGAITYHLDGEAVGHALGDKGVVSISGATISALKVVTAAARKFKAILIG